MDINKRILSLQLQLNTLRMEWKNAGSLVEKSKIEKKALTIKREIRMLESVLKKKQLREINPHS